MKSGKIAQLRAYVVFADTTSPETFARLYGTRFDFRAGAYEMRLAGVAGTSTMSREAAKESWIRAAHRRIAQAEDDCPGHVASADNPKVCGLCGIRVDELRPDDDHPAPYHRYPMPGSIEAGMYGGLGRDDLDDPINLAGSGPVPIKLREG